MTGSPRRRRPRLPRRLPTALVLAVIAAVVWFLPSALNLVASPPKTALAAGSTVRLTSEAGESATARVPEGWTREATGNRTQVNLTSDGREIRLLLLSNVEEVDVTAPRTLRMLGFTGIHGALDGGTIEGADGLRGPTCVAVTTTKRGTCAIVRGKDDIAVAVITLAAPGREPLPVRQIVDTLEVRK